MGGKPCIRGMWVTVETIVELIASGATANEILTDYPYLEPEDIAAALSYAAWRSEEIDVPLAPTMKFVIDMNLSPRWCGILQAKGWDNVHWSQVGIASAPVMQWAFGEYQIVLTHDLDYGAMLAATRATGPSVVQVRTQDVRPQLLASPLIPILRQYENGLVAAALLIADEVKLRVRLLPLSRR